jgi:aminoglycoside phosphotransferase (APT) family kinase protein
MPAESYPCHWSVCGWLAGENAIIERIADLRQAAIALSPFVAALQRIDPTGGPPPERTTLAAACRSQSSKKSSPITNTPLDHEPARLAQTVVYAAKGQEHF